ncbi:MAG: HAD family hydrolase [Herpetosiphon sp.]
MALTRLRVGTRTVEATMIIFDKDGTLVDLHEPWGQWAREVATNLADKLGFERLLLRLGWDGQRVAPESPLAVASLATLQDVIATWLYDAGLPWSMAMDEARRSMACARRGTAAPVCALAPLFKRLTEHGLLLGIVSTDDQIGIQRDLEPCGVLQYIAVVVGCDAGLPPKPAPQMMMAACGAAGVSPNETIVVGDSLADLWMGRAAGAALTVGVLSGACSETILGPHADVVLRTVEGLVPR